MSPTALVALVLALSALAYWFGQRRALALAVRPTGRRLHSRPGYHGLLAALWCAVPALCIVVGWQFAAGPVLTSIALDTVTSQRPDLGTDQLNLLVTELRNLVAGHTGSREIDPLLQAAADRYTALAEISRMALAALALSVSAIAAFLVLGRIHPGLRARNQVERAIEILLTLCSTFAVFITIGIVLSVLFESIRFFQKVPFTEFLFGLNWSPQMAIRADQVGSSGSFGAVPVLTGTFLISAIAMSVAVPFGLMSAIYLSEYAGSTTRAIVKPLLEILAGVPTVVYGYFAALTVAPALREFAVMLGIPNASTESALAAGIVMGVMIIPFVSSMADDSINAVPQAMRDGSLALGATPNETIRQVLIPAALPGVMGGILLAVSRAIGETMIVVMAAGLSANLTANPFASVTTVTAQIVKLLTGDQEFDSAKTLAAFALGLVLFIVTLLLNIVALRIVKKYREAYE